MKHFFIAAALLVGTALPFAQKATDDYVVYVGTYTENASQGIFDRSTGRLTATGEKFEISTPVTVLFVKAQ
jgi:6-phosphogluconolactonase (cycloisomerase 2 family)